MGTQTFTLWNTLKHSGAHYITVTIKWTKSSLLKYVVLFWFYHFIFFSTILPIPRNYNPTQIGGQDPQIPNNYFSARWQARFKVCAHIP